MSDPEAVDVTPWPAYPHVPAFTGEGGEGGGYCGGCGLVITRKSPRHPWATTAEGITECAHARPRDRNRIAGAVPGGVVFVHWRSGPEVIPWPEAAELMAELAARVTREIRTRERRRYDDPLLRRHRPEPDPPGPAY